MLGPDPPLLSGISETRSSEGLPLPKSSTPALQQSTSSLTEPAGMKRSLPGTQSGGTGDGDGQMSLSPDHPSHAPVKQPKVAQAVAAGSNNASGEAAPEKLSEDPHCARHKEVWQSSQFVIRRLEGHSDLVTAVAFHGSQVISGSRDTTVKVWHVPTAREERNLGGHTGEVSCLAVIPEGSARLLAPRLDYDEREQFVASGSSDSSIIIWALLAGVSARNIYTFSAVTSLIYLPEADLLISGSGGGKVQLWDPVSRDNKQSLRGHCDRVTAIQAQAGRVFTASADGEVKVWKYSRDGKLHLLYASGRTNPRFGRVRCLAVHNETLYLGGDWPNLKLLQWERGTLSRLANHLSESGVTDCLSTADDVLIASGYNSELGQGYLNVRSLQDCAYLGTISCPDLPRVLCLATWRTTSGLHRWATGGEVLLVWEQLGLAAENSSALRMSYYPSYDRQVVDSESEDGSEISDCELGTIHGFARRDSWRDPELQERDGSGAGGSWCRLV